MNILNDTAKLYQLFGGQAGDYQELRRSDQAKLAKQRWPLLAWLDLSALHVSEAPKVQLGETPLATAAARPVSHNAPLSTPVGPQFTSAPNSPMRAPLSAPSGSPLSTSSSTPWKNPKTPLVPNLSPATAPYLQQLLDPPARLQALGTASQAVSPVASAPVAPAPSTLAVPSTENAADASKHTALRDVFARIAQPTMSPTNLTQPAGSLWSNLTSKL